MLHRGVCLVLVCTLLNLTMGCVVRSPQKTPVDSPEFAREKFSSVVLRNGSEIAFRDPGAEFLSLQEVRGVTLSGDSIAVPLHLIGEARVTRLPIIPLDSVGNQTFAEALLNDGTIIQFNPEGGTFQAAKQQVVGITRTMIVDRVERAGKSVAVPSALVEGVRMTRPPSIGPGRLSTMVGERVQEVVNWSAKLVAFGDSGGVVTGPHDVIHGSPKDSLGVRYIPLEDVLYTRVDRVDAGLTILATLGGIAAAALVLGVIAALTKESCPFVYSFDGQRYVFDGEPLGGATTRGLVRTDYSRLEHLRAVEGKYALRVRNEVDETQYLDRMRLVVVDHDSTIMPVARQDGTFFGIPASIAPVAAYDDHHADILPFVRNHDGVWWQTHMDSRVLDPDGGRRHTLTLKFHKPRNAERGILVVDAGTSLWGSHMIRELYLLRGNDVDAWHRAVDRGGPELYEMLQLMDREEVFTLSVRILKDKSWVRMGDIVGGGPLIAETQTIPLSLSRIHGDTLLVQLRPPPGFWTFDRFAIIYDRPDVLMGEPVAARLAVNQHGEDVSSLLGDIDSRYAEMPTKSDIIALEFDVPPSIPNTVRTVFLESTGYYRLHLPKDTPMDSVRLARIARVPGAMIDFSFERYRAWQEMLEQMRAWR